MMNVCVIGAGAAGLAAAKNVIGSGFSCVVFEKTGNVGGTWVYRDETDFDEFGLPIHTSMYKNLRANLPKEVMGYPDYQVKGYDKSYLTQQNFLTFLNNYADHFNVRSSIKFYHNVTDVRKLENKWEVDVTDLKNSSNTTYCFDAIMICSGHYFKPSMPNILGRDKFKGEQLHSHSFRDVNFYKNQTVLVIGAGPSGLDVAFQVATVAKQVLLSHHSNEILCERPGNLLYKPDVKEIKETTVLFADNTSEFVDVIIYCTGYLYDFPFLNDNCGITVEDNRVQPLYKHLININNTTMCFIGLPFYVCAYSMFDLQARFFIKYLAGGFNLPTTQEMLNDENEEMIARQKEGLSKKQSHMMGPRQGKYYEDLARIADIEPLPPVLTDIHNDSSECFNKDILRFRDDVYKIVDEYNFVKL